MAKVQSLQQIKKKIAPVLKKNGVSYCAVFGSFARGEQKATSDVDLLVKFSKPIGLFKFAGLERELSKVLGRDVDITTVNSLHPIVKKNISRDFKIVYG